MPQTPQTKHFSLQPHAAIRHQITQRQLQMFQVSDGGPRLFAEERSRIWVWRGQRGTFKSLGRGQHRQRIQTGVGPRRIFFSLLFHSLVFLAVS